MAIIDVLILSNKMLFLLHDLDLCIAENLNRAVPLSEKSQCLTAHFDLWKVNVTWKVKGRNQNWTIFLKLFKELV